ncbi:MAG TPA: threonine aldolase, partial [Paenarthrobacter sp.]|nr:threonine aldolase [Paenarthrobacter sp.]
MTSTTEAIHSEGSTTDNGRLHNPSVRGFASDNYSGVHPEILA